jgi:uncharacterized protein
MELSGDYTFDAPQTLVWAAMQDPEVLGSVMPGGEGFAKIAENEFGGKLKVRVGPVQGVFEGNIKLQDVVAPTSYTIVVDGKGAPGFVKATGNMKLEARDTHQTYMQYSGNAQIGGRIASVGQRLMDSSARSIIRQSLEGLNEYLKVQAALQPQPVAPEAVASAPSAPAPSATASAGAAPAPVAAYKPPSQMKVGLTVMRDVFNDFVPPSVQPFLAAGIIAVLVILFLLSRG